MGLPLGGTRVSLRVFQAWQLEHWPCDFKLVAPHSEQTQTDFVRASVDMTAMFLD
jgi:hypothetical protein